MKPQMMMTKELAKKLPEPMATANDCNPYAYIHYFHIIYDWHWYVIDGKPVITLIQDGRKVWKNVEKGEISNDWIFFAKVISNVSPDGEYGSVYLSDIIEVGEGSIPTERDKIFSKTRVKDCNPYHYDNN